MTEKSTLYNNLIASNASKISFPQRPPKQPLNSGRNHRIRIRSLGTRDNTTAKRSTANEVITKLFSQVNVNQIYVRASQTFDEITQYCKIAQRQLEPTTK
jgi:hypothetical protein